MRADYTISGERKGNLAEAGPQHIVTVEARQKPSYQIDDVGRGMVGDASVEGAYSEIRRNRSGIGAFSRGLSALGAAPHHFPNRNYAQAKYPELPADYNDKIVDAS